MNDSPTPERWQRIEALLDAALDLPPERRGAMLDAECAGDTGLREEVDQLLRACGESESLLRDPALEFAAPILDLAAADTPVDAPGTRFGPYRILEEAGRGGMAVVYLAERDDGQFRKQVALKVVRPGSIPVDELGRRFREERQILAGLEHPGIARLLDGGVTEDGRPWLAMEYVAGTPIEQYCDQHRLSVEARLEIFCRVCDAVHYAHRRQIVHRDLKPGNILVTEPDVPDVEERGGGAGGAETGEARVKLLDFGIAKLLSAGADEATAERTRPGLRFMTPEYASPEQVRGEAVTPATDVHALGVLLYRLLSGRHPYRPSHLAGHTIQRSVLETRPEPPSAAVRRAVVEPAGATDEPGSAVAAARGMSHGQLQRRLRGELDAIVLKALSKEPEDRYADAGELVATIREHLRREHPAHAGRSDRGGSLRKSMAALRSAPGAAMVTVGGLTIVLALAVAGWLDRGWDEAIPIDPELIVVAPFLVATEAPFDYLHEGLADLLATSLNGEKGSRAVDPRSVMAAWRGSAMDERDRLSPATGQRVARGLGAGLLLTGSVVGTPERLAINATLYDAVASTVRLRVGVHGPADSLATLVDRLTGQLLTREAGLPGHTLAGLTTTSLPALRAYLEGRSDYRGGRMAAAAAHLQEALSYDSTFALAAINLARVANWGDLTAAPGTNDRALRLAWAARDRLSTPDRLFLEALAGPRYPDPTPRHELLAARSRAVDAAPDQPDVLALMGGHHVTGVTRGEPNALQLSTEYFGRALALDSSYARPAYNLVRGAVMAGDTATVRRIVQRYLATDSVSEVAQLLAWAAAAASGDESAVLEIRARMPSMHPTALGWIVFHALLFGLDMDGAGAALSALRSMVRSDFEWGNYRFREWEYLGNRGRLAELWSGHETAARDSEGLGPVEELGVSAAVRAQALHDVYLIRTALFWGGDSTGIGEAMARLEDTYHLSPAPDGTPFARTFVADAAYFAGMGRIGAGDVVRARAAATRLNQLVDGGWIPNRAHYALGAATLDALVAVAERRPDARRQIERADSLLRHDMPGRMMMSRTQLVFARALADLGDPEAGLRVIRRRQLNNPAFFLATILAEEGRLAALVGDREGAIRAYRHYLVLRTDPDPLLVPEVERIRAELAGLLAER